MTAISIDKLIESNRLLEMLNEEVMNCSFYEKGLHDKIKIYVEDYIQKESPGNISVEKAYFNFIRSYNKDMKQFATTGKYPLELDVKTKALGRFEYNVVLLFSCLFSVHRFRIMQLIDQQSTKVEDGLFIGCGPGLELELVKSRMRNLFAYDLTMDNFLFEKHPSVFFKQEYFDGKNSSKKFDSIYLIEILEHLSEPYDLLKICASVLKNNGSIYLTTATNIPQFDHLYNFSSDHKEFEQWILKNGFVIKYKEDIIHNSVTMDIDAKNRFYVISKNLNDEF